MKKKKQRYIKLLHKNSIDVDDLNTYDDYKIIHMCESSEYRDIIAPATDDEIRQMFEQSGRFPNGDLIRKQEIPIFHILLERIDEV